ncbi:hypothetical protein I546_7333 [Mycobacterium kansasii 732]|nr:hypothetical protein I546_7333 [Mycobacterium kansasii 732]
MLRLVVVLPDGTPGMVGADATDVFGSDAAVLAGLRRRCRSRGSTVAVPAGA